MANKNEVEKQQQKARLAALDAFRRQPGFPIRPRRAMGLARKQSKTLQYPLAPYPVNLLLLYQWARGEWESLGRYKKVALPVMILVALTTWEKEFLRREARWDQIEHEETAKLARELYLKASGTPRRRRFPLSMFDRRSVEEE
jgi:hypothetical protein